MNYLYNPPLIIKKFFSEFYWETTNNKILLTFDDSPNPRTTETILKVLNHLNIKSLFFCVGNNINKHGTFAKIIIDEGHTIGNHTYNHKVITKISNQESVEEINRVDKILFDKFGYENKYFRPPHGKINFGSKKLINNIGLKCVMWNLLTFDFENNINKVKKIVKKNLSGNSIVVLHDSLKSKDIIIDSISFIYDEAKKKGYDFGEATECLN